MKTPLLASILMLFLSSSSFGQFGAIQEISPIDYKVSSTFLADMDGDGHDDLLTWSYSFNYGKVSWYKNDGQGNFGERNQIASNPHSAVQGPAVAGISAVDLNNDGNADPIWLNPQNLDSKIYWAPSNGNGTFGLPEMINGGDPLESIMLIEDVDGDGDYDVVSAIANTEQVIWFEND